MCCCGFSYIVAGSLTGLCGSVVNAKLEAQESVLLGMELAGLVEWSLSDNPPPRQNSSTTSLAVDPLYLVVNCGTSDPRRQFEVVNRRRHEYEVTINKAL
jgi:hypothetical protein